MGIFFKFEIIINVLDSSFSHLCCWLSLRDVWISPSHTLQNASLLSLILPLQLDIRTRKYILLCLIRRHGPISALVTTSSTRHHIKPSPKGSDLMSRLVFPTMPYEYILNDLNTYICYRSTDSIYRIITEGYNPLYVTMVTCAHLNLCYSQIMQATGRFKASGKILVMILI